MWLSRWLAVYLTLVSLTFLAEPQDVLSSGKLTELRKKILVGWEGRVWRS